jgi:hypothetical protein
MASRLDYFVESAVFVADHGDALVREGCDSLAGQFLIFIRNAGMETWRRVGDPMDRQTAVSKCQEIPSVAMQGRMFAEAVRDIWNSPMSDETTELIDRLCAHEEGLS